MQFITFLSIALLAAFAAAQNPFSFASIPESIPVGSPFNITWSPSTGQVDTVTLVLRQGDAKDLATVETIASHIQNIGSYLWTPSPTLVNGPLYAFQIIDDGNTDIVNYFGPFSISSPNTITPSPSSPSQTGSSAASTGEGSTSTETRATTISGTKSVTTTQTRTSTGASTSASVSSLNNTGGATMVSVGCGGMLVLVAGIMIGM